MQDTIAKGKCTIFLTNNIVFAGTMVSKDAGKCMLTNSESDSEATATSMALEVKGSSDESRHVRKRNKALQVRFKDICEAQNEQAAAARGGKPVYKVAYRKYMTVPARRSIPNVTKKHRSANITGS